MTELHSTIAAVTKRIVERSRPTRRAYLDLIDRQRIIDPGTELSAALQRCRPGPV